MVFGIQFESKMVRGIFAIIGMIPRPIFFLFGNNRIASNTRYKICHVVSACVWFTYTASFCNPFSQIIVVKRLTAGIW